ncbi:KATNB1-like protein 1 [Amia ocellicauda]|uniref:KATNB1-like protein 1 n=1 Tax=Amia ocellicauda TaxID=2972642 RepID=UPI0034648D72
MASGVHDAEDKDFQYFEEALSNELLKQRMLPSAEKNMKEVDCFKKEDLNKKRSPVGHTVHSFCKVKRVVSSKRKTRHVSGNAGGRRRQPSDSRSCDMANKENELACADGLQEKLHNDSCGFPLSSTESTRMDGAASKYSDYFAEISKDHETMTQVLFGRNLRLNVALTLWRRNASELVAYLIRIQDMGVLVDCLPVITKSLQDGKPTISVGCCVDLLPLVKNILTSKYEEYLVVALHWVQSVIQKWWPELSANSRSARESHSEDRNIGLMKQQLLELWEQGRHLSFVPGTTGEIAKTVESYLLQLR